LQLSQCFISHEKLFQPLFKIISATMNMLQNIHELQQGCEMILK